jgi:hypothetical protein
VQKTYSLHSFECHPPPDFPPNSDRRPSRLFSLACYGWVWGRIGHQYPKFARNRTSQRPRMVYCCNLDCGQHLDCPTQTSTGLCTYPQIIFSRQRRLTMRTVLDHHNSFHSNTPSCTDHIHCVSLAPWRLTRKGDSTT